MRRALLAAALASKIVLPASAATARHAPDISLVTTSGSTIRTADLKGKVVLLDFWASWCIPCRRSFPEIDALGRELAPKGLAVIAVNVDEQQKSADAFLAVHPHSMPVALDSKGKAAEAFDLKAMPSTIVLDRNGQIRFMHQGYTEKTIDQFRSEVLQLLAEGQ
jgi:thiol-disulfide isomerase/thioredoxin